MTNNYDGRLKLIAFGIIMIAFLLLVRLFFIQIIEGEKYGELARRQYLSQSGELFDRGSIFFRNRNLELISAATLNKGYKVAINPEILADAMSTYDALSKIISLDLEEFLLKAKKVNDPYEEVAVNVSESNGKLIKDLKISGVGVYEERWRFYPARDQAAHILGFVGFRDDDFGGRYGLERYYNDTLKRSYAGLSTNFFAQIFSGVQSLILNEDREREGDLVLTIEPIVQGHLESVLEELAKAEDTELVGGIIMDPNSGEIFAMAISPDFNPNNYGEEDNIGIFTNPLVESVYEMGSIVKPLTIAAALDAKVLTENDVYEDRGEVTLDGETIRNYDGNARGAVPIQEILNQSLNTGAVYAMQALGRDTFKEYMLNYGIGERTLIDLPDETRGLVSNLNSNRTIEYATASFGQGIAVTPIGMTRALASLANGGYLVRPHLVSEINYKGFPKKVVRTEEQGRVISGETSERITRMMVKVVDDALRGGKEKLSQYSIAAKTGTAQIPDPRGGYYNDKFLHSFFGYFPAYEPRFLVFLYGVDPKTGRFASETLTDPFMDITKFLLNYYEITPDR